ncbi:MAG: hypothetical protein KC535_03565 [Nanoarchaeota archaeon]|nr:hypothetical protein [Nanoarchaeota archaeon]
MRRSKIASMELSINAIVILVMAMAVLGIGLGLIRGVLSPAQGNLEDALGKVDLNEQATSTKPIANLPQTLRMKNGDENELVISFYNANHNGCEASAKVNLACTQGSNSISSGDIVALEVPVASGTSGALIANVKPSGFTGSVPCKVEVICSGSTTPVETTAVFVDFSS